MPCIYLAICVLLVERTTLIKEALHLLVCLENPSLSAFLPLHNGLNSPPKLGGVPKGEGVCYKEKGEPESPPNY